MEACVGTGTQAALRITFDVSDCPGADPAVHFDADHLALMGHSMGAWIAPLAASVWPKKRFKEATGGTRSPKSRRIARASIASLSGVPVPCALT